MSYDFGYRCPCCDSDIGTRNLTHNVNQMVTECLKVAGVPKKDGESSWSMLNGKTAAELLPLLHLALQEATNPDRRKEFDSMMPDNGWGKRESVIEAFLWAISVTVEVLENYKGSGVWYANG